MIRVSATLSKKVPIVGQDYSSQQFGGSLEIEVSDAEPEAIKGKIARLYALLSESVEEQIKSATAGAPTQPTRSAAASSARHAAPANGNGNGNGSHPSKRGVLATAAQVRAIHAIATRNGVELASVLGEYGVGNPEQLTVKAASQLIDKLKR